MSLVQGNRICFGTTNEWLFVDDGPPVAMAIRLDDGQAVASVDGVLALPLGAECPEVTVYQTPQGKWLAERRDQLQLVGDHDVLLVAGGAWRLHLPEMPAGTWEAGELRPTITSIALRFSVSSDEEYVQLTIVSGEHKIDLGNRAHHYPLLILARARLREQDELETPMSSRGWMYQDELLRMLDITNSRLNIDIHRIRQQFATAGIVSAANIVERRPATRQVRLGVGHIEIVTI